MKAYTVIPFLILLAVALSACCETDAVIAGSLSGDCQTTGDVYICPGESATLCWQSSEDVKTVSISSIGTVSNSGTQLVTPSSTTTYKLSATGGECNITREITVFVVTDGMGIDINAPPNPNCECWETQIPSDRCSQKIAVTSLSPMCAGGCYMHLIEESPQDPFENLVPDDNVLQKQCLGGPCLSAWDGKKKDIDGHLSFFSVRGSPVDIPDYPLAGSWQFRPDPYEFHVGRGNALFEQTVTCNPRN